MRLRFRFLLLFLLAAAWAHAQSTATLSGTLSDPSGAAVAGADVTLANLADAVTVHRTVSDAEGRFEFRAAPGRYRLRIIHRSFARTEQELALAPGEHREVQLRLALERLSSTVVVTAHAEPVLYEAAAAPVAVVTREDLDARQAVWLAPVLAATPGLAFSRLGREGGVTTMFLGGGNSNFTKVLIDGTPANEPGGAFDLSNFALDNVEKIEILRGASSALFGSDAMAGVVQIFTRRGVSRRPVFGLEAEGGKFSTARGAANLSGALGRFDYSAAAGRFETRGQEPNDSFRATTLSGNFGWQFTDTNSLRLAVRSAASDAGVPGQTLFHPPNLDQHNALRNFSANLRWDFETSPRWRHTLAGTETYIRQLFDNPASDFCSFDPPFLCDFPFTVRNQYNRAGFRQQSSYLRPGAAVTFGYEYEAENGWLGALHAQRNNHAGYFEARLAAGPRLWLTAGARAEGNASFGTRVVPRAGAAYALRRGGDLWGDTRLRFSYGLGIKEPAFNQSFAQDDCFPGNPSLRPERSRSFNAGAEQFLARDRVRLSADFFHNRFRDIVSFTFCFPGGPCPIAPPPGCPFGFGTFFNTDRARAYGATFSAEAQPVRWLRVAGNYTWTASRVLESPNAFDPTLVPGNRLFKRPAHAANLNLSASFRQARANLFATYVGRRTDSDFLSVRFGDTCIGPCLLSNPGYARVDLAAAYDLRRGVTAFGRVENLFDKRYQDSLGYPALRRHYRLGMRFTLGGE